MEKTEWLDELFNGCESREELYEMIKEYIEENCITADEDSETVTKAEYDALEESYKKELNELKESFEKERTSSLIESEILSQGGKNPKAILAIISDKDMLRDESGKIVGIELSAVKESAPYLFKNDEEKGEGTGAVIKTKKRNGQTRFMESARRAAGLDK